MSVCVMCVSLRLPVIAWGTGDSDGGRGAGVTADDVTSTSERVCGQLCVCGTYLVARTPTQKRTRGNIHVQLNLRCPALLR